MKEHFETILFASRIANVSFIGCIIFFYNFFIKKKKSKMHVNDNVKITVVWITDQIFFNCRSSHNNEEKKNECSVVTKDSFNLLLK